MAAGAIRARSASDDQGANRFGDLQGRGGSGLQRGFQPLAALLPREAIGGADPLVAGGILPDRLLEELAPAAESSSAPAPFFAAARPATIAPSDAAKAAAAAAALPPPGVARRSAVDRRSPLPYTL